MKQVIIKDNNFRETIKVGVEYMEKRLMSVFNSIDEGFAYQRIICDENGQPCDYVFIDVNDAFGKITGFKKENIIGKSVRDVLPDIENVWIETYGEVALTGKTTKFEQYNKDLNKWFKVIAFSLKKYDFCVLFVDITDIKKAIETDIKYKFIFDNSKDVIMFLSKDGKIVDVNKGASELYGYEHDEFIQLTISNIREKNTLPMIKEQLDQAKENGVNFETLHVKKDGTIFPVEVSSKGIENGNETIIMSVIRDISERKDYENNLINSANNDYLTGLPNRRHVFEYFSHICELIRHGTDKLAVIYFDIDKFKSINDTYGHDIGDEVLKEVAIRINKVIRKKDMFGRIGGDEFVLLQSFEGDQADVLKMVQRIISEFNRPILKNGLEIYAATSIGVSIFPDDATDKDILMSLADKAMYQAKKESGSTFLFYRDFVSS